MGKTRKSCGEVFPGVPEDEEEDPGKKKRFEEMKELLLKNLKDTEEKHNLELKFENTQSLLESEVRARERAEAERDKLRGQLTLLKELILNDQSLEKNGDAETPAKTMKGPATRSADVTAPVGTQKTKRPVTRNSDETEDMNVNDSQDAEPSHKKKKYEERKEQLLNNLKHNEDNECLEKQLTNQMDHIETFSKQKKFIRKIQEKIHREYGRKVKTYANHARIWRGEKLIKFTEDQIKQLERVKQKLQRIDDVNCEEEMKKQIQSQKKLIEELQNNLNIFMKAENQDKNVNTPAEEEGMVEELSENLKHNKVNSTDEPIILNELEKQIQYNKTFIEVLQNNIDNLREEGINATGLIQVF